MTRVPYFSVGSSVDDRGTSDNRSSVRLTETLEKSTVGEQAETVLAINHSTNKRNFIERYTLTDAGKGYFSFGYFVQRILGQN